MDVPTPWPYQLTTPDLSKCTPEEIVRRRLPVPTPLDLYPLEDTSAAATMTTAGSSSTRDTPVLPPQKVTSTVGAADAAFPPLAESQTCPPALPKAALPKDGRTNEGPVPPAEGGVRIDSSANADIQTSTEPSDVLSGETEAVAVPSYLSWRRKRPAYKPSAYPP